ncbi:MAG: carbohydrate binding family 9 domain-containing protein, partial [Gemmatimonadetes bacterium]|nr:carbohydrate binding family 9 domain-containing protein [Gemmatimonadota bacterium]
MHVRSLQRHTVATSLILLITLTMSPAAWGQAGPDHRTEGDARGQDLTVRAVRVAEPPEIDGVLDEPIWQQIEPITGFRQRWPVDGAPASERTEVRIAYDSRAIYFAMIMFDSEPERILANILHRGGRLDKDDGILIGLDTYHDRRSAYIFEVNPLGTQDDAHFTNESLTFPDDWAWEGVYESEGRITDRGWELEVAIPLTTIRFEEGVSAMGVAFYRSIRRKNERVTWPHIPQRMRAGLQGGMDQASQYATLVGFEDLEPGRHIEVKPYGILGAQKLAGDEDATTLDELGLDVKYSLTPGLTLDLTYNTDFAPVEVDNV